jgi:hypothetical protein
LHASDNTDCSCTLALARCCYTQVERLKNTHKGTVTVRNRGDALATPVRTTGSVTAAESSDFDDFDLDVGYDHE